jgi:peptide/nickel transport system substrate-binding protein
MLPAACASPTPPTEPDLPAATILLAAEPTGVNPLLTAGDRSTQDLIDQLFLHLFEEQPDFAEHPPTFAPQLATEWVWSGDGLRLRLELRRGVLWSDGVEVTAEDVLWTWQAQRDPSVAWRYAESKAHIVAMQVLDPYTLEVEFDQRSTSQLADLNEGNILPEHVWGQLSFAEWPASGDWFRRHLVTDGPFRLAAWTSQEEIVLGANPDYFQPGLPALGWVTLRVVPLRENRLAELTAGRADFIPQLTPAEGRRLVAEPGIAIRRFWHRQYDYLAWNTRRPPFTSTLVRRALTLAIDRQAVIDAVWDGLARIAVSPIPANVWAHHPGLSPWPHDPQAAHALLVEAGWLPLASGELVRGGEPFAFELLVNATNPLHVDAAVLISEQLAKSGIEVTVRQLDFHAMIERLDRGDFDAVIGSWGIDTSLDLGYAFHSRSLTEGYNSGGYANGRVDSLIESTRATLDLEERRRLLHELQEILHDDQPYTFLWEPPRLDAHRTRLEGVQSNPLSSLFRLAEWRLAAD